MSLAGTPLPSLSRVNRLTVLGIVGLVTIGATLYLALLIHDMAAMPMGMALPAPAFGIGELTGLFVMWTVMQAAMMLPTALPMTFAFARMAAADRSDVARPVAAFTGGYAGAWMAFSIGATLVHAMLNGLGWLGAMDMTVGPAPVAGAILLAAGVYQWLPAKQACLKRCRSPLAFLMTEWRDGPGGAFAMGWRHGLFCVGCCWALMALLFVAGAMNPFWIVAIAVYVLVEKAAPHGDAIARIVGLGLAGGGGWLLLA